MKYFLDFGTHCFGGLEEFIEKLKIDNTFHVLCFEPNKPIYELSRKEIEKIKGFEDTFLSFAHFNLAVMDYSGEIAFNTHNGAWTNGNKDTYVDGYTCGSNCLEINPTYDSCNGYHFDIVSTLSQCIDVENILSSIVEKDEDAEIYVKCDIEGSEFVVLPRMLQSQHISKIKSMYIEWHERFWYGTDEYQSKINQRREIIDALNELHIQNFVHT